MTKPQPDIRAWHADFPESLMARYRDAQFHMARFPFLINDRVESAEAIDDLRNQVVKDNEVFMGILGFRSLDLLANIGAKSGKQYSKALLFDGNLTQVKAMRAVLLMIDRAETPSDFIEQFIPHHLSWVTRAPRASAPGNPSQPHPKETSEDRNYFAIPGPGVVPNTEAETRNFFKHEMRNQHSWLHPDNFARIKKMAAAGDIIPLSLRLDDPERVRVLSDWLMKKKLKVRDMYLSSIPQFARNHLLSDYYGQSSEKPMASLIMDGVDRLADNHTRIAVSGIAEELLATTGKNFKLSLTDKEKLRSFFQGAEPATNIDHPFSVGNIQVMLLGEYTDEPMTKIYCRLGLHSKAGYSPGNMWAIDEALRNLHEKGTIEIISLDTLNSQTSPLFAISFSGHAQWERTMAEINEALKQEFRTIAPYK